MVENASVSLLQSFRNDSQLKQYLLDQVVPTGKTLGIGSYGSVVEVEYRQATCAAKRMHKPLMDLATESTQKTIQNYQRECRLLAGIRHPNITQFLGLCFLEGSELPLLVMERLEMSVDDLLECASIIPLPVKISILTDACSGLVYLHNMPSPIVHRDLTARNVLLTSTLSAKIADLGNSRIVTLKPVQLAQTLSKNPGTTVYMPPEGLGENQGYEPSLDVFSFGHFTLYILTQVFPGNLLPATSVDPDNPGHIIGHTEIERREEYMKILRNRFLERHPLLVEVVTNCLSNDSHRRPTAEELLGRLQPVQNEMEKSYGGSVGKMLDLANIIYMKEMKMKDKRIQQLEMLEVRLETEIGELMAANSRLEDEKRMIEEEKNQLIIELSKQKNDIKLVQDLNTQVTENTLVQTADTKVQGLTTQVRTPNAQVQTPNTQVQTLNLKGQTTNVQGQKASTQEQKASTQEQKASTQGQAASTPDAPKGKPQAPKGRPQAPNSGPQAPKGGRQAPKGGLQAPKGGLQAPKGEPQSFKGGPQTPKAGLHSPKDGLQALKGRPQAPKGGPQAPKGGPQAPKGRPQAPKGGPQAPQGRLQTPKRGLQIIKDKLQAPKGEPQAQGQTQNSLQSAQMQTASTKVLTSTQFQVRNTPLQPERTLNKNIVQVNDHLSPEYGLEPGNNHLSEEALEKKYAQLEIDVRNLKQLSYNISKKLNTQLGNELQKPVVQFEVDKLKKDAKKTKPELGPTQQKPAVHEVDKLKKDMKITRATSNEKKDDVKHASLLSLPSKLVWKSGPDMPIERSVYIQSVEIDGKIYVGGGYTDMSADDYEVVVYNTQSCKWQYLPKYIAKWFAMTSIRQSLVLVGGLDCSEVGMWLADSNKWTHPFPPMSTPRLEPSTVAYKHWLVVAGGQHGSCMSSVEVLNVDSKQWCIGLSTPTPWKRMKSVAIGDTWYLMGGYSDKGQHIPDVYSASLEFLVSHPPSSPVWTKLPSLNCSRSCPFNVGNSLMAVGGEDVRSGKMVSTIQKYILKTNTWENAGKLPYMVSYCTCIRVSNQFFVMGGLDAGNNKLQKVFISKLK